jgi:predicted transcriptional regulator
VVARENDFDGMTREELLERAMNRGFPHLVGKGKFVSEADRGEPTDEDLAVMVGRSVRLPAELDARVRRIADELETSVSDLIRQWISQGVAAAESRGPSDPAHASEGGDERWVPPGWGESGTSSGKIDLARRDRASATLGEAQIKSVRVVAESVQRQVDQMMRGVTDSVHRQLEQMMRESTARQASIVREVNALLQRQAEVLGEPRAVADDIVSLYLSGCSIRAVAEQTGRSYGFVHRVLTASGVQVRRRGGAFRRRKVT